MGVWMGMGVFEVIWPPGGGLGGLGYLGDVGKGERGWGKKAFGVGLEVLIPICEKFHKLLSQKSPRLAYAQFTLSLC